MLIALTWLGCDAAPTEVVSRPVPPTADLVAPPQTGPRWMEIDGFLPPSPGIPRSLGRLDVGLPDEAVEVAVGEVALKGARVVRRTSGDHVLTIANLHAYPTVNVVVVSDGTKVLSIQVNLPPAEASLALDATWGAPAGIELEGSQAMMWSDGARRFVWSTFPDPPVGLLKIEPLTP